MKCNIFLPVILTLALAVLLLSSFIGTSKNSIRTSLRGRYDRSNLNIEAHCIRLLPISFLMVRNDDEVFRDALINPLPFKNGIKSGLKSDTIDVLNYAIHLDIVYLSAKTISGYTELTITPKINNVSAIPLDLLKMTVDSVLVDNSKITVYAYNDTLLRIPLASPANTSDTLAVRVYYHGHPVIDPSGWGGFYFSSDSMYAYNLGVGFQDVPHNYGRVWFPCLDDFIDRATYDCYIRVKDTKTAVCGGTLINETNNGDGTKTFYWRIHSDIPTYLASVAIGNYVPVSYAFSGINGNIPVKIYVPATDTNKAKASFVNLLNILAVYENDFGAYQWERVGYVGVPFNNGAMEHSTNIAYPLFCIDGTLSYEDLYAHELSHQWFGDLVTCASAEDMWINEGWASYCESIFREGLYGSDSYNANVKSNHNYVLSTCHTSTSNGGDEGYFAIYGIPENITYGSTVYNKGADVVYTLRNYLGDSLFFAFVKAWMNDYKFNHISTYELSDFITSETGVDVNDFFDGWVFSAGFPHYSIDSVKYAGTVNDYTVYVKQKLHHKPSFINSNKIGITFMSSSWQTFTETIEFSGQYGNKLFHLPFIPVCAMMDLNEKVSDATTDYYKVIHTTDTTNFTNSFFVLEVQNIADSVFFRIEHNWVAPDPLKAPSTEIYRISDRRYWKVDGVFPLAFKANGKFNYNRNSNGFENNLLPTNASSDSLVLLYRANAADDWHIVNFVKSGSPVFGYLTTENLMKGEYTFGIGKPNQSGIDEAALQKKALLNVYPNPSDDTFFIQMNPSVNSEIRIYDASNKLVFHKEINSTQDKISWKPSKAKKGNYFIYLYEKGKPVAVEKVVYVK
ncbi:MAG: M1 family aminopeptidase [Bacteroidales bacterium]